MWWCSQVSLHSHSSFVYSASHLFPPPHDDYRYKLTSICPIPMQDKISCLRVLFSVFIYLCRHVHVLMPSFSDNSILQLLCVHSWPCWGFVLFRIIYVCMYIYIIRTFPNATRFMAWYYAGLFHDTMPDNAVGRPPMSAGLEVIIESTWY